MANDGTVDQQQLQATINEAYQTVSQMVAKILSAAQVVDDRTLGELSLYSTIEAAIAAGQLGGAAAVREGMGLGDAATRDAGTDVGNLMEVGAFGLGSLSPPEYPLADMDEDPSSVRVGTYRTGTNTSAVPSGPGIVEISRYDESRTRMVYTREYQADATWSRTFVDGVWTRWARHYFSNNVIGTVTNEYNSAIIESGENTNGRYTKFADGTLICRISSIPITWLASYRMGASWTYPHAFSSSEVTCNPTLKPADENDLNNPFSSASFSTEAQINITLSTASEYAVMRVWLEAGTAVDGDTLFAQMTAIGRWK